MSMKSVLLINDKMKIMGGILSFIAEQFPVQGSWTRKTGQGLPFCLQSEIQSSVEIFALISAAAASNRL